MLPTGRDRGRVDAPVAPGRRREAWGPFVAALCAVLLAAPWPLVVEGRVPRLAAEPAARATGYLGAWRFEAERRALDAGPGLHTDLIGAPEGVELMVGEHGALWTRALAPLARVLDPPRAFVVGWVVLVAAAAGAAAALGLRFGLSAPAAALAGAAFAALPAFAERGASGLGGLAAPTVPLAALGILLALTSGDRRAPRALAGGLLAGLSLMASLWIGVSAALASLLAAALMGLHVPAARGRAANPGWVGIAAVVVAALLMLVGSRRIAERLDGLEVDRFAYPVTVAQESEARRPLLGLAPLHPLRRAGLGADRVEPPTSVTGDEARVRGVDADASDPRGSRGGGPAAPASAGDERSVGTPSEVGRGPEPVAHDPGDGAPSGAAPRAPLLPVAGWALLVAAVLRRGTRASALGALGTLLATAAWAPASLAPALWTVGAAWALLLGAACWQRMRSRALRVGLAALLALELCVQPFPGAGPADLRAAVAVARSPVEGGVVELPYVREPGPHLARSWTHGRPTPLRPLPAREDFGPGSAFAIAPDLARLATGVAPTTDLGGEPPLEERLAAELTWLDVGHLLVDRRALTPGLEALLDRLPGWERGPTAPRGARGMGETLAAGGGSSEEVLWWYRASQLWSAEGR